MTTAPPPRIARTLLVAASATALAVGWTPPAAAQDTVRQQISMEAQPLNAALVELGRRYGVTILAPSSITRGKTAKRISGNLTAEQAISRVLTGSGLIHRSNGNGGFIVSTGANRSRSNQSAPAPTRADEQPEEKETIIVSGVRYSDPETPLTRAQAEVREIPNSITVLTDEVIEDQILTDSNQILTNVAGVNVTSSTDINSTNGILLRGIGNSGSVIPTLLRENGLSGGLSYAPDPFSIRRVEVIKGPAAIAGGGALVGGLINRVLKTADGRDYGELLFTIDTFGFARVGIDIGGGLSKDGRVSGRLVAVGGSGDGPQFLSERENLQITPSLNFEIGNRTELLIQGNYNFQGGTPAFGPPVNPFGNELPDIDPQQTILFDQDDAFVDEEHLSVQADLVHQFLDDLSLTARVGFSDTEEQQVQIYPFEFFPGLPESGIADIYAGFRDRDFSRFAADVFLTKTFDTGGQESSIVVGTDYVSQTLDQIQTFNLIGQDNVFNPTTVFRAPDNVREEIPFSLLDVELQQVAAYGQLILRPTDKLTLVGGLRYDTFFQESSNFFLLSTTGEFVFTTINSDSSELTWRAGASYEVTPNVTVYGSYATSFLPNAFFQSADGQFIQPEQGEQFEIGAKASLFDERLSATISAYTIDRTNIPIPNPDIFGFFIPGGEDSLDGIEVEVAGEPIDGLRLLGAYSYQDVAIVDRGDPAAPELPLRIPEHTLSLFGTYEIQQGPLRGLGFGGRLRHASSAPTATVLNAGTTPAYTLFDLTVFYRDIFDGVDLRIYVENVGDVAYFPAGTSTSGTGNFGPVRNAVVSLTTSF